MTFEDSKPIYILIPLNAAATTRSNNLTLCSPSSRHPFFYPAFDPRSPQRVLRDQFFEGKSSTFISPCNQKSKVLDHHLAGGNGREGCVGGIGCYLQIPYSYRELYIESQSSVFLKKCTSFGIDTWRVATMGRYF